jgi:hypothetical protein
MKSALKGRRFCDATDIIKDATEELKRLSKNSSINVSNEGNIAYMLVIFLFFRNKVISEIVKATTYFRMVE